MKKTTKHQFRHADPEKKVIVYTKKTKDGTEEKVVTQADTVPRFVYRDLKRTGYIIGLFILILVALFVIQLKTNWLTPVLHVFGL